MREGKVLDLEEYRKKVQQGNEGETTAEFLKLPPGLREIGPSPWFSEQNTSQTSDSTPPAG